MCFYILGKVFLAGATNASDAVVARIQMASWLLLLGGVPQIGVMGVLLVVREAQVLWRCWCLLYGIPSMMVKIPIWLVHAL